MILTFYLIGNKLNIIQIWEKISKKQFIIHFYEYHTSSKLKPGTSSACSTWVSHVRYQGKKLLMVIKHTKFNIFNATLGTKRLRTL